MSFCGLGEAGSFQDCFGNRLIGDAVDRRGVFVVWLDSEGVAGASVSVKAATASYKVMLARDN